MKRTLPVALAITVLLVTAGCTAGPNKMVGTPDEEGKVAGFWHGLWHGFIALFTFVVSLFTDSVRIYDVHNNGNWYNLGFLIGIMIFFGGSGKGTCRRRRK